VFREAEVRGYLTDVSKPILEVKGIKSKVRPAFTIDEVRALLAKFEQWITKSNNKQSVLMRELMFDYINVLLDTGARPGKELRNLRWQQIVPSIKPTITLTDERDEEGEAIEISSLNRSVLMTVSGKTGQRDILGMKRTMDALVRIAKRNYKFAMPLAYPLQNIAVANNKDYVFVTNTGARPTNFNNIFTKFLTQHNLLIDPKTGQNRVLYSLRHTYATLSLEHDKVPIHTLAKQMGTSVAMIEKHYSHLKVIQAIEQLRGEESRQLINAGGVIDVMYDNVSDKQ
jgi:integrase